MIALDESARPWIRPEYEVIPLDGSAVLIRSPDQGVRASIDGVDATELADRIRSLDGTRTIDAWRRGAPDNGGIDRLIRELVVRDVVRLDPPALNTSDASRYVHPSDDSRDLQLFAHYHHDPNGCRQRLRSSRVVICGSGALTTTIQRDLRAVGIERVDLLSVPERKRAASGSAIATGIDRDMVAAELRGVDLTIVCTASPRDPWADVVNDIALSEHLVWLPLLLFGASAFIGPLFVPGDGPCQQCVWAREQANWADPDITRLYFDRLARDHASLELYGSLPAFEALTSQWAVLEVTKVLSRFTVPVLLGSLLRIEFLRAGTELHRVVRLPRCPRCSPMVRSPQVNGHLFAPSS
jgi:bacteriocin biosynthesis cyclodehydratase domain-containing protein